MRRMTGQAPMKRRAEKWMRKKPEDKLPAERDLVKNWKILRGDKVQVMSGQAKGQQGLVRKVLRRENRVLIRGVNLAKKRVPPNQLSKGAEPRLIEKEMP